MGGGCCLKFKKREMISWKMIKGDLVGWIDDEMKVK